MRKAVYVLFVLAACLLLPAGTAWGTIWAYDGSVDPTSANSAGAGLSFELYNYSSAVPETLVATTAMYPPPDGR